MKKWLFFMKEWGCHKKKERYNKIDINEVAKYKNWKTAYDEFFIKNNYNLEELFLKVFSLVTFFGYEPWK